MKHTVLLLSLVLLIGGAQAQKPKTMEDARREREEYRKFRDSLNLTPEQKKKLQDIRKTYEPQQQKVRFKYDPQLAPFRMAAMRMQKPSPEDAKKQSAIQSKLDSELKPLIEKQRKEELAVYTPEQRAKLEAYAKQHK